MAISNYSQPFRPVEVLDPIDFQFLDSTLGTQQAKFDQGYLQIANTLQSYSKLDLVRQEDIDYRNRKVSALKEQLSSYGNQNLADVKVASRLNLEAASLADDKELISKLSSTKNFRQLNDRYQKMKENPKLLPYYSEINEYHDRKVEQAWLNGELKYMPLSSPTLKVDTDKIAGDVLKTIQPKVYSEVNGLYIVDNEVRSESDLRSSTFSVLNGKPEVNQQLKRNADYVFRGTNPDAIYQQAIKAKTDDIAEARESVLKYQNQLKDASISKETKASIEKRIKDLAGEKGDYQSGIIHDAETKLKGLSDDYATKNYPEVDSLKYQLYTDNWVRSVTQPYIVNKQKVRPNQVEMFVQKQNSDALKETNRMAFEAQQKDLDRQNKLDQELIQANIQLAKTGQTAEIDASGNIKINGSTTNGSYYRLSVLQNNDKSTNALQEIDTRISGYQNDNKAVIAKFTEDVLKDTDRSLLTKVQPLLREGNLFDKDGKFLGDTRNISKAQIDMLRQYDDLLDNSSNPEFIKNNQLLNKYGAYKDELTKNQLRWESLQDEKDKARREVFDEAWKNKETNLRWNDFNKMLDGTLKQKVESGGGYTYDPITGGKTKGSFADTPQEKFLTRVNDRLNNSPRKNEFITARDINPGDKTFNDPDFAGSKYAAIQRLAAKNGVLMDGVSASINGQIQGGKSYRDNLENVESIQVTGIIPNTNQVMVNVMTRKDPDKKELVGKSAILQLNPDEMKELIGRNSDDQPQPLAFRNGEMTDRAGNPLYFNLSGSIPDMMGNIQYRYFNFDDKLSMSINIPVDGVPTEVNIKGYEFNTDAEGKLFLVEAYKRIYQQNQSLYPDMSKEDLSKKSLQDIYNQFD